MRVSGTVMKAPFDELRVRLGPFDELRVTLGSRTMAVAPRAIASAM